MKKNQRKQKYILLIAAVVLAGIALAIAFASYIDSGDKTIVRSEIVYFILSLLILLPVCLIALLIALAFGKKEVEVQTVNAPVQFPLGAGNGYPSITVKAEKGKGETDEEGRSRFYMLCEIDANRARYSKASYDESITLKRFCEEFRNFACHKLKLFYPYPTYLAISLSSLPKVLR